MPEKNLNALRSGDKLFNSLCLIVLNRCNLKCLYCYEKHDLRSKKRMELSVAKDAITEFMEKDDGYDGVEIEFFGGEPFLEFSFIKEVVEWFHTIKWKKLHQFLIGTNGTILNDEIKDWLIKYKKCLGVAFSFDGTKKAHDLCRDNSYDIVFKNIQFFRENWPNQPAKMTICADTIPYVAESVIELEEMGLLFTANLGFENFWDSDENKDRLLKVYEEQLSILVDYYAKNPKLYPVSPLLNAVPDYLGLPNSLESIKKDAKRFCGAGHGMTAIDIDGTRYPCHRFVPWVTGRPAPGEPANCQEAWTPDKCFNCKLILSCPTCAGYNWEVNSDTGMRTIFHCEFYKIEVLASCKLHAIRLSERLSEFNRLSLKEKKQIKVRYEALMDMINNGI